MNTPFYIYIFMNFRWLRISRPDWQVGSENNQQIMCRKVNFTPPVEEFEEVCVLKDVAGCLIVSTLRDECKRVLSISL